MSAPHSSSENCPGHNPLTDLLGDGEPSEMVKAAAEALGVSDPKMLGLVLTYFMAAAIESTDLGTCHMLVDGAPQGILLAAPAVETLLAHAESARQLSDRAAAAVALASLYRSVQGGPI